MKQIFSLVIGVFLCGICFGQEHKEHKKHKEDASYCCVKKDYCGEKAKKCPKCAKPLIKIGLYYCNKCSHSSKKPGTCGKCDITLIKMEGKK